MKHLPFLLTLACAVAGLDATETRSTAADFSVGRAGMAVVSVEAADRCGPTDPARVSAVAVWIDGRYEHELLLFPGSGRGRYDTLLGPLTAGRHRVELRPSAFWQPSSCVTLATAGVAVVAPDAPSYTLLRHAPVLELRADTVGEQTDALLFAYVEDSTEQETRHLRYTVVFSNEDGGTPTRSLFARWGRTTDIEQVYDVSLRGGRIVGEEYQGPDHEIRPFNGRRHGIAPILLVATTNNMVTDRGRGIAPVRPVPERVDLSLATRESTLDSRPWTYRVMARELAAEGKIAADAPAGDQWVRQAPDPRDHVYLEARLTLDHAVAAAWVRDRQGRRISSNYEREGLAIDRDGWVRSAVATGASPASAVAEIGWSCLAAPGRHAPGTCVIEATRAFVFADSWLPGPNLVVPAKLVLREGEDGRLALSR